MHKERFNVEWTMEGSIEVLLPPNATEAQVDKAARNTLAAEFRKGRGALPAEINIGKYEGPY